MNNKNSKPSPRKSPQASRNQSPRRRKEQQRAVDTKSAILQAALAEFAALGFDGATARGIAESAEVNHTVITHHFGNKENLWKATATYVFERYAERINERAQNLEGVDEKKLVRLLMREFILFCADVPEFNLFMTQASQAGGDRLSWLVENLIQPSFQTEVDYLERAQRNSLLGPGDTNHLRLLFIGAATSIFTWSNVHKHLTGEDSFSEDVVDRHIEMVLDLFQIT